MKSNSTTEVSENDSALLHIARRECVVLGGAVQALACKRQTCQSKTGAQTLFFPPALFFSSFTPFPSFFSPHLLRCEDSCWFSFKPRRTWGSELSCG